MQEHFANTLKALRKARGISQEQLADRCGVTVQAVSKWECAQSLPDITLLPVLADYFGISIDRLLRSDGTEPPAPSENTPPRDFLSVLPDDDQLRILWCRGQTVLYSSDYPTDPIPLRMPENMPSEPISFNIHGSACIEGAISGSVTAGNSIQCGDIGGNATAGDDIICGGDIGGNAYAGDDVFRDGVNLR